MKTTLTCKCCECNHTWKVRTSNADHNTIEYRIEHCPQCGSTSVTIDDSSNPPPKKGLLKWLND